MHSSIPSSMHSNCRTGQKMKRCRDNPRPKTIGRSEKHRRALPAGASLPRGSFSKDMQHELGAYTILIISIHLFKSPVPAPGWLPRTGQPTIPGEAVQVAMMTPPRSCHSRVRLAGPAPRPPAPASLPSIAWLRQTPTRPAEQRESSVSPVTALQMW